MDVFEEILREEKNLAWVRAVLRVHFNGSAVVNSVPDRMEVDRGGWLGGNWLKYACAISSCRLMSMDVYRELVV
jgi:hypothetical protein